MYERILPLLLLLVLAGACSTNTLGPGHRIEEGVELRLNVRPAEVRPHQPFTARISVTNRRSHSVTLVTRQSCIALFEVYAGERLIPLSGTENGCHPATTQHTLRPGESLRRAVPIWAEAPDGAPISRGEYLLRVSFSSEVFEINGAAVTLPDLEQRVVVR
ncbi:hypothetical protein BH24GEM3_BH24GEM3_22400 [soil metagenome]